MSSIKELLKASVINLDKPSNIGCRDIDLKIKDLLGVKKVGHAGTLDNKVTGVLVLCLNEATKIMPFLINQDKEYEGIMYLHNDVDLEDIQECISDNFIGVIVQKPPLKSAVARKERKRKIHSFEIIEKDGKNIKFRAKVQAGTYIRKLVDDIGKSLEIGAHMKSLRRINSGEFSIKNSFSVDQIKKAHDNFKKGNEDDLRKILIPVENVIPNAKKVYIKNSSVGRIRNGSPVFSFDIENFDKKLKQNELVGIFSSKKLIGIGTTRKKGKEFLKKGVIVKTDRILKE